MSSRARQKLMQNLIKHAQTVQPSVSEQVRRSVRTKSPLPESVKPGATIKALSPLERTLLQSLTPEELNHRIT